MANNKIQVKRTNVSGRTANVTNAGNAQYIDAGEFALNMADGILYTSNGSALIEVGANNTNKRITNTLTLDNNKPLRFTTVNTSAVAYFIQQNDDNFVFYTTSAAYGARPVWSIFANSDTSALGFGTPVNFTGANVNLGTTRVFANGTSGTAGQVLTSNGTASYWSTVSGGSGSVNVDAQYVWTNTQTFNANISYGNNIALATNAALYFNGIADANWRIGRNTSTTTKFFYTGNTIDIVAAGSSLEGIAFGQPGANTYLETGYNGTYTRLPIYVGNSTQNVVTTNLSILLQTNTTVNSTHTASLLQIANSTATSNLTATSLNIYSNSTVNGSLTSTTVSVANSTGNVQAVPTSVTVQNSTVNAVMGLQSVIIQSNTTVNGSITNALVQVANSTGNVQVTATTVKAQTNTTVNSTISSSLVQVSNSTSTANLIATGLQTYTNSTVNSTVSASLVQVSNSTSTANLSAIDLKIGTTTVNSSAFALGTAFTANSTIVNAVSYYSGTLLVANTTVINATHLAGSTFAAPPVIGSGTANGISLTYANVSGQVNTATLFTTGAANVSGLFTASGGSKISVMEGQDGGNTRGIFLWNDNDTNWGIYMSQAGVNKSLANGTAAAGLNGSTTYAVRFRAANASPTDQAGFIWENYLETALMQLEPTNGDLFVKRNVNGASFSTGANFIANTTQVTVSLPISANGGTGTAGQVLTSAGSGNAYWAAAAGGGYYKGGSATVGTLAAGGTNLFRVNANTLNYNTTISTGENAQATGPIAVASGITLTVESGARVSIV